MVQIEIKGCPKGIHFVMETREIPHPRYGERMPYYGKVRVSDPDCPCRQKIRKEMTRA